uniref:Transposase-associated domain-containing protein n=1 Tax=Chenopodium quinoa TaxID=63459 RepID=A0A803MDF8_CHEQI
MEGGTKNWWMFAKWSDEYEQGVDEYVKRAFAIKSQGNQIYCPYQICQYRFWRCEGVVRDHLICNGFVPISDKLSDLGFNIQTEETILDNDEGSIPNDSSDDVVRLLHDARDAFREGPNDEAKKFLSEHKEFVRARGKRKWNSVQDHSKDFVDWFREKVDFIVEEGQDIIPNNIIWLSKGPSYIAKKYTEYSVNGYRFHTMKRDANCVTQNSGVTLTAMTHSFESSKDQNPIEANFNYYGSITDIISISYHGYFCVVLFKCVWFHSEKDDDELIMINMCKTISKEEPFILASQAHQMKGSKAKAFDSQSQLQDYELQRLRKLKYNAERIQDDGSSGDSDMEQETLGTGKRQVSSQQHPVPTREIQRKQQEQQLGSTKASVKKIAFYSPGSIMQLNETADALQEDCEGNDEGNEVADRAVVAQFGIEGQPVGPTKEIVQEFKFFLGTVARDSELAPLNHRNFPSLPTLDKILDYVQEKYMVPHAGLNWVMDAVNSCWKYYKCQIKKKHFYAYDTDDLRWKHKPDTISDQMFEDLLQYWHTDEAKEKIDALESAESQEDGNVCNDPYNEVIPPPRRKSRVHLYGSGVKKSDLKNKDTKPSFILPEEFLVGLKAQLVQEIAPTITTAVLDSIREVNPGINLVVPSTLQQLTLHDASSAPNRNTAQSGQSSKSFNQVLDDDELPRDE